MFNGTIQESMLGINLRRLKVRGEAEPKINTGQEYIHNWSSPIPTPSLLLFSLGDSSYIYKTIPETCKSIEGTWWAAIIKQVNKQTIIKTPECKVECS